ncbi:MAG: hypothetical protein ACLQU3_26090 [Limisphaerales bacterium]
MNDAYPEAGFGQSQLGAQNVARVEFNYPTFLLQIAATRFYRINEADVDTP